jgi:hypothetical protein
MPKTSEILFVPLDQRITIYENYLPYQFAVGLFASKRFRPARRAE